MARIVFIFSVIFLVSIKNYSQCSSSNLVQGNPQASFYGSVNAAGYEPSRAFDLGSDSMSTKWSAPYSGAGQQFGVDFGVKFDFCSIRMVWGANAYPTGIVIKGTNDFPPGRNT